MLIQDSDLENDPQDYPALLAPLKNGSANVVYGVRPGRPERGLRFFLGAKFPTQLTNFLYGAKPPSNISGRTYRAQTAPKVHQKQWWFTLTDCRLIAGLRNLLLHSDGRVSHPKDVPQYVGKQVHQRASDVELDRHNTIRLNRNFCYRAVSRMALFLFDIAGQVPTPELLAKLDEAWKKSRVASEARPQLRPPKSPQRKP